MGSAADFYDGLSDDYECLFQDWWPAAQWHGRVIADLLAGQGIVPPAAVLDCACGIGTQALPLAERGYVVTGTDVSRRAVDRARAEASERGITATWDVADMRTVGHDVHGQFDAVIACDNALPHLLTDDDLTTALQSMRACLRPGGLLLASLRDYDVLARSRPTGQPVAMHGLPGERHAAGQAWAWSPAGDTVDITLFTLRELAEGWRVSTHETTYRALQRSTLTSSLTRSGYDGIRWMTPEESGYFQPVVLARAASG